MELENYFDFLSEEDIRIKGSRAGIETVLDDYHGGASPEEIVVRYRALTLEQVYATITYYPRHQKEYRRIFGALAGLRGSCLAGATAQPIAGGASSA